MDKGKEIEEIYDIIASNIDIEILESSVDAVDYELLGINSAAKEIIDVCYRKADEIKKEIANSMYRYFKELRWHFDDWQWAAIYTACKVHGAEVDE